MKQIPLLICLLTSLTTYAQVIVGTVNINEKPEIKVCEIIGEGKLFSSTVTISLEYGQERKEKNDAIVMDPATNKPRRFVSMTDAINFMENNGWSYRDALLIGGGNGSIYHFFFKRKEATE
jgi:hypothetical protein